MSRFWSPLVHALSPYVPGEQPKIAQLIKLNTNEHPWPPSPKVAAAIAEQALTDRLRQDGYQVLLGLSAYGERDRRSSRRSRAKRVRTRSNARPPVLA